MLGQPSPEEALKLVVTFYCIMEPERRRELMDLAEKYAMASPEVEGIPHFRVMPRNN
jgi:antitoxin component of MazEF toxin-antitoxin module